MYLRQDCAFAPSGELFTVCASDAALTANGVEIPGYAGQFFSRLAFDGQGVEWIITSGVGVTLLRNRELFYFYDGPYGYGFSALRALESGIEVYLQGGHDGVGGCIVTVKNGLGITLRTYPMDYSSNGMIDIAPSGSPISANRGPISFGDMTLWNWMERDGYYLGNSNAGTTPDGSVGLIKSDGSKWMAELGQSIQLPPRLAVKLGHCEGAASGKNVPTPPNMPWQPAVVQAPPVIVPDLPEIVVGPQRACYIDDMSGQGYGNSSGVGGPAQTQRIFEDARFLTAEFEPYLIALVHGPFEGSELDKTIATGQRLKKPVILSYDGHSDADLQPTRTALEAAGLTIWEGRDTYPNPPDESADAMYDRMALTLMADSRPQALIAPGYRVHGRSEADIAQFNLKTNDLKERFAQVRQVAIFGMDRAPIIQWCRDFWRAVTVKTPIPFVPPPIVVVPPTPEPEPPKVGKWAKLIIAIRKLFGRRR